MISGPRRHCWTVVNCSAWHLARNIARGLGINELRVAGLFARWLVLGRRRGSELDTVWE
jgi:hypothetical protein